jgi:hypothetical protein
MRLSSLAGGALLSLSFFAFEATAGAGEPRPVMVEYVAPPPPECASIESFQAMVTAEMAHGPRSRDDWQFAVRVWRDGGGYAGTVTTAAGARTVQGPTCDDTTAALAQLIAGTEAEPAALPPLPPRPPEPPPIVAEAPVPAISDQASSATEPDTKARWRLGARFQTWTHGAPSTEFGSASAMSVGGMGVASVELPWGIFHKTMFEAAAGAMDSSSPAAHLRYYVVDTQACLVDVALGSSGLSLLGCLRLAGAWFSATDATYGPEPGGALWAGGGVRLRWQSEGSVFVEAHLNGVYGTVSGAEVNDPGWADVGAMVGLRL